MKSTGSSNFCIMANDLCYEAQRTLKNGDLTHTIMLSNMRMSDASDVYRICVLDTSGKDAVENVKFMVEHPASFIICEVVSRKFAPINSLNRKEKYQVAYIKPIRAIPYNHDNTTNFKELCETYNSIEMSFYTRLCDYMAFFHDPKAKTKFFDKDFLAKGLRSQLVASHPELKDEEKFYQYLSKNASSDIEKWWDMYWTQTPIDTNNMKLHFVNPPVIGMVNRVNCYIDEVDEAAARLFSLRSMTMQEKDVLMQMINRLTPDDSKIAYGYVCADTNSGKLVFLTTDEVVKYFKFFDYDEIAVASNDCHSKLTLAAKSAILSKSIITLYPEEYGLIDGVNSYNQFMTCHVMTENGTDFDGKPIQMCKSLLLKHTDWLSNCVNINVSGENYFLPKKSDYEISARDGELIGMRDIIPVVFVDVPSYGSVYQAVCRVPMFIMLRKYTGGQCSNADFVVEGTTSETLKVRICKK